MLTSNLYAASKDAKTGWYQFRGPNRNGKSLEKGLLKKWPEGGPQLLWQIDGIGEGFSTVTVADGLIYTSGNLDDKSVITIDNGADAFVYAGFPGLLDALLKGRLVGTLAKRNMLELRRNRRPVPLRHPCTRRSNHPQAADKECPHSRE